MCVENLFAKVSLFNMQGAASISGLRCLTKTVQICCDMKKGRLLHVRKFHCLIASDDGSRLSRNPLQVLLLCVGKTAIMYAKTVQREDCTSVSVCVCRPLLLAAWIP